MADDPRLDPRFIAGVDMVRRTGCHDFEMRYDDEQEPVVWVALAHHTSPPWPVEHWTPAAALDPISAVMKLCEELIDGGQCAHCSRPSMFDPDPDIEGDWPPMIAATICVTRYDPELKVFRRDCEGDT